MNNCLYGCDDCEGTMSHMEVVGTMQSPSIRQMSGWLRELLALRESVSVGDREGG